MYGIIYKITNLVNKKNLYWTNYKHTNTKIFSALLQIKKDKNWKFLSIAQYSKRQCGKQYMSNEQLNIFIIALPSEFDSLLAKGFQFGKLNNCSFITKKEFKKLNI